MEEVRGSSPLRSTAYYADIYMIFNFGEIEGDPLMEKIDLRDIGMFAKQWDHPMKGLFKYAKSMRKHGGDIHNIPKKDREHYCVSLVALAFTEGSYLEWWTHMLTNDPPDGVVITFKEEFTGEYKGYMREVEVVEHRDSSDSIFTTIKKKMTEYSYKPNTILVCLILFSAIYDFKRLADQLSKINSSLKHIFVIFAGISLCNDIPSAKEIQTIYTMVQLLPVFE